MKASELRIGNYVKDELNNVEIDVMVHDIEYMIEHPDHDLNPIPLTEEWLLEFGFEFDTNLWHNQIALYPCPKGFNYNVNFFEYDNLHTIEYVHQLQNLFFALTNEELTIKQNQNK